LPASVETAHMTGEEPGREHTHSDTHTAQQPAGDTALQTPVANPSCRVSATGSVDRVVRHSRYNSEGGMREAAERLFFAKCGTFHTDTRCGRTWPTPGRAACCQECSVQRQTTQCTPRTVPGAGQVPTARTAWPLPTRVAARQASTAGCSPHAAQRGDSPSSGVQRLCRKTKTHVPTHGTMSMRGRVGPSATVLYCTVRRHGMRGHAQPAETPTVERQSRTTSQVVRHPVASAQTSGTVLHEANALNELDSLLSIRADRRFRQAVEALLLHLEHTGGRH
jgi:hypothetical protein